MPLGSPLELGFKPTGSATLLGEFTFEFIEALAEDFATSSERNELVAQARLLDPRSSISDASSGRNVYFERAATLSRRQSPGCDPPPDGSLCHSEDGRDLLR